MWRLERVVGQRRVLGMSAPVWTLVAWLLSAAGLLALSTTAPLNPTDQPTTEPKVAAVILAGLAVALFLTRGRTRGVLVHVAVTINILLICWLVEYAVPLEIALMLDGLFVLAVYVGYWMPRNVVLAYMAGWSVATFVALTRAGILPDMMTLWLITVGISALLASVMVHLAGRTEHQVIRDPLTGLLNRAGLDVALRPLRARNGHAACASNDATRTAVAAVTVRAKK